MTKKYWIARSLTDLPDRDEVSLEATTTYAKKRANSNETDFGVFELVAIVKYPIPDMEVIPVTA